MSNETKVTKLPKCDIPECSELAHYDGKTKLGPWAFMCEGHFKEMGTGLGVGVGQRLVPEEGTYPREAVNSIINDNPFVDPVSETVVAIKFSEEKEEPKKRKRKKKEVIITGTFQKEDPYTSRVRIVSFVLTESVANSVSDEELRKRAEYVLHKKLTPKSEGIKLIKSEVVITLQEEM